MLISIIIPSFKAEAELQSNKQEILNSLKDYTRFPYEIILTCQIGKSAAINRNYGLNQAKGDIIVQMDDDITGLFPGWLDLLIEPLLKNPRIILSSARLMKLDGKTIDYMNGSQPGSELILPWFEVPIKRLPTACVATRKDNLRFWEEYISSGFEDTDWNMQLNEKYPEGIYVICNNCKIIHRHEMKGAMESLEHNRQVFYKRWGHW